MEDDITPEVKDDIKRSKTFEEIKKIIESANDIYEQIQEEWDCLSLKDLAVTGRDLIAAGMKPGPQLGQTLQNLLQLVLEDPSRNSKEYLLSNLPKET